MTNTTWKADDDSRSGPEPEHKWPTSPMEQPITSPNFKLTQALNQCGTSPHGGNLIESYSCGLGNPGEQGDEFWWCREGRGLPSEPRKFNLSRDHRQKTTTSFTPLIFVAIHLQAITIDSINTRSWWTIRWTHFKEKWIQLKLK
ncbi:hypothetical protein V3C99_013052 [Haemonchus contortus]